MVSLPGDGSYHNFWQRNAIRDAAVPAGQTPGDCGPASVGCALSLASQKDYDTGIYPYGGTVFSANKRDAQNTRRAALMAQVRKRAGEASYGGTSQDTMRVAFLSYGAEFAAVNRQAPAATRFYPGTWTDYKAAIVAGKFGSLGIWRQPLADSGYFGSDPFGGKHAIIVGVYDAGTDTVLCFDPLLDGRYNGYGKGPVRVPISLIKSASDLYTPGSDSASVGSVYGWTFSVRSPVASGQSITAISVANPTHVTTAAAHGLTTGDYVAISGTNSTPALTGPYAVTVLDATHFTVAVNVTVSGNAGTWTGSEAPGTSGEVPFSPCKDGPS